MSIRKPSTIDLYLTCSPYSKQDWWWDDGEDNRSLSLINGFLRQCDSITVADPHFCDREWAKKLVDKGLMSYLNVYPFLVKRLTDDLGGGITMVQPGKHERTGYPLIRTKRIDPQTVEVHIPEYIRDLKRLGIVDDFLYTGGTLDEIARKLRNNCSCEELVAVVSHVVDPRGAKRIASEGSLYDGLYVSNSCDSLDDDTVHLPKLVVVNITNLIGNSIIGD